MLCSLSASVSRVAVTGADTALYNSENEFLKNEFIVLFEFIFENFLKKFMERKKWLKNEKLVKFTMIQLLKLYLKLDHLLMINNE